MHILSEPAILYFGTPVVLISTLNEDGSYNIAPMSSAFWLGWRCILGLAIGSKTTDNLLRTGECVLNLPSEHQVDAVDKLALTTGSDPIPNYKQARGYEHVRAKFERAGLSPQTSETVAPPRIRECFVQLEATVEANHGLAEEDANVRGKVMLFETRMQRIHLDTSILLEGQRDRVDPDKWRPLIMSFQQFYGLSAQPLRPSALARIAESKYRSPDMDRARGSGCSQGR